jgi:hypothetical protein
MSEQDRLDALARGSQREEKKRKGDRSMNMMWESEEVRFRDWHGCGNEI